MTKKVLTKKPFKAKEKVASPKSSYVSVTQRKKAAAANPKPEPLPEKDAEQPE